MKNNRIESFVEREIFRNGVALYFISRESNGRTYVSQPITMAEIDEGEIFGDPAIRLSMDDAQVLIDQLWRAGLRPTDGAGSAGSMAATERHLEDMKAIAFGLLEKSGMKR